MKKRIFYICVSGLFISALILGIVAWRENQIAVINIEWETDIEIDTAGFDLYRSISSVEGFEKLNLDLIPASDDPLTGSSYTYSDENVIPGETYYYLVVDVDVNGSRNQHGPIQIIAYGGGKIELVTSLVLIGVSIFLFMVLGRTPDNSRI